jgi:eukaryotic-like serine/threonine-protein kinase
MGKPGWESAAFYSQSSTAAYYGLFSQSRERVAQAVDSSKRADNPALAAAYQAAQAVREALVGNSDRASQGAQSALSASDTREVEAIAAMAFADSGETQRALPLAANLAQKYPEDTVVQANFLPTIRAAIALKANHADQALDELSPAAPYELGSPDLDLDFALYPVYFRGLALLMKKQGAAAAGEFEKIVDHPGVVQNEIIGALAHLGLAQAYVVSHNPGQAKMEYQNFLITWKDADPELPILKQARDEYAKLQ